MPGFLLFKEENTRCCLSGDSYPADSMSTPAVISIREQGGLNLIRTLLQQGVTVRMRVSGVSMLPLIRGGDLIEVAPLREKKIRRGDIVFICDQRGQPLVHRLHRRRYDINGMLCIQTKGDGNACYDPPVPINRVFGRVRRIVTDRQDISLEGAAFYFQSHFFVARTVLLFPLRRCLLYLLIFLLYSGKR